MNLKKILIIKPSSLGDIIHSLPVLHSLKRCLPEARIHWVVAKNFAELLNGHPMIDRLWIIEKDRWKRPYKISSTIKEFVDLGRRLREERFDLVIDLQGLLRSGLIAFLTGSPLRIGFKEAREGSHLFYTQKVEGGREIHAVERYLKIASYIGCPPDEIVFPLPVNEEGLKTEGLRLKERYGDYAVLVPGARWPTKRWPPERFGQLAGLLPLKSIVIGGKEDIGISEEVVRFSNGKAISLAGKTGLKSLVEIIRGARLVVGNDSGPMHIAPALGIPTFAIFGPTSPLRTGPYGKNAFVIKADLDCAPCFRRRCRNTACMKSLQVEEVRSLIAEYLHL